MAEVKEELKPCPFCGAKAQMLNYSKNEWLAECSVCSGMVERWRETEEEAIEQWNRRVNDDPNEIMSRAIELMKGGGVNAAN